MARCFRAEVSEERRHHPVGGGVVGLAGIPQDHCPRGQAHEKPQARPLGRGEEIPRPQKFYVRDQGEVVPGHLAEKAVPEDPGPVNNAVDFAIAAGHFAQDHSDRPGVGDIAGVVRGLDPGGMQIRQGLSHLRGPVIGGAGLDARGKRRPPQEDQPGPEGRQAAGQVGGDARRAPGHDDHVSRAQVKTCRAIEDRRGDPPLRSEDPAIPMHHLHHGVAPVQMPRRRRRAGRYPGQLPGCGTGPMGIPGRRSERVRASPPRAALREFRYLPGDGSAPRIS